MDHEDEPNKTVQILLNGYEQPVILSDADSKDIVFLNDAAKRELGSTGQKIRGSNIHELFRSRYIIQQREIWERLEKQFYVNEDKIAIDGKDYIQSTFRPMENNKQTLDVIEARKEMAKLLVHRFNSPLNGVTGFMELLKELDLTDKQAQYLSSIEKGIDNFQQILSDVHRLAEDVEPQWSTFNTQDFILDILDQYSPEQKERIELDIDSGLAELHSDYVLLKDMITELLDNALFFSGKTGPAVQLQIKTGNVVRVTSFGESIPPSQIQKIFYPFFTQKARGNGLGLPKCIYYAQELGYQICLSSNSAEEGISFDIRMD